jgi:hypothetical protein
MHLSFYKVISMLVLMSHTITECYVPGTGLSASQVVVTQLALTVLMEVVTPLGGTTVSYK